MRNKLVHLEERRAKQLMLRKAKARGSKRVSDTSQSSDCSETAPETSPSRSKATAKPSKRKAIVDSQDESSDVELVVERHNKKMKIAAVSKVVLSRSFADFGFPAFDIRPSTIGVILENLGQSHILMPQLRLEMLLERVSDLYRA